MHFFPIFLAKYKELRVGSRIMHIIVLEDSIFSCLVSYFVSVCVCVCGYFDDSFVNDATNTPATK